MIQLVNYLKESESFPQSGTRLLTDMETNLMNGNPIEIDLSGVLVLPSMFLNASFGKAIQKYGYNNIRQVIHFYNITKGQAMRISDYFRRYESLN